MQNLILNDNLATKGSLGSVPIAYVRRQRGGGWTGHITHRALTYGRDLK